jgi:hypothetical protein
MPTNAVMATTATSSTRAPASEDSPNVEPTNPDPLLAMPSEDEEPVDNPGTELFTINPETNVVTALSTPMTVYRLYIACDPTRRHYRAVVDTWWMAGNGMADPLFRRRPRAQPICEHYKSLTGG